MILPKLLHGFIRLGCNVQVFNDREVARVSTPLLSSAAGRAAANRKLLQTCRNFQPDLVLLGHYKIIENRTLDALRASCPGQRIAYRHVETLTDEENHQRHLQHPETVEWTILDPEATKQRETKEIRDTRGKE